MNGFHRPPCVQVQQIVRQIDMGIVELLTKIGDEKIKFQNLDNCAENIQKTKKCTKIRFQTEQEFDLDGTKDLGLVIWLPRAKVNELINQA